jgi:hypothetical protein
MLNVLAFSLWQNEDCQIWLRERDDRAFGEIGVVHLGHAAEAGGTSPSSAEIPRWQVVKPPGELELRSQIGGTHFPEHALHPFG